MGFKRRFGHCLAHKLSAARFLAHGVTSRARLQAMISAPKRWLLLAGPDVTLTLALCPGQPMPMLMPNGALHGPAFIKPGRPAACLGSEALLAACQGLFALVGRKMESSTSRVCAFAEALACSAVRVTALLSAQ